MSIELEVHSRVRAALEAGTGVVALETTAISHGLPWPDNLDTAHAMNAAVAAAGAVPAFIGIVSGRIRVGLDEADLEHFARASRVAKASRRDLPALAALGLDGATTVAATMICANLAGIEVFATGGIGGVHRGAHLSFDVSADITELGRTPVAVVCSGAKSILDIPATLEALETEGVPVIGFCTDHFPAFYSRESELGVTARAEGPEMAARVIRANRTLGAGGLVIANPIPHTAAIEPEIVETWVQHALQDAERADISGKDLTPFLLDRVSRLSAGRTLSANMQLLENNAGTAAAIACALAKLDANEA